MARQGISTGTIPNDGTGDTLLSGAIKINENFSEVYGLIGDGTNAYVGIVTQLVAGSNISISTSYGSVTVNSAASGSTSYWSENSTGIHTLSNVGIGTTTASSALTVSGDVSVSGVSTFNGGISIPGGTGVSNRIELGNSEEFTLQYNTSSTKGLLSAPANDIEIQATNIKLLPNVGENGVIVNQNGSVELYYDNLKKFETLGAGITVTGTTFTNQLSVSGVSTFSGNDIDFTHSGSTRAYWDSSAGTLNFKDSDGVVFGTDEDVRIVWDGTDWVFSKSTVAGSIKFLKSTGNENIAVFTNDGSVELYYDNSKKFETIGAGVTVTGTTFTNQLSVSGVSTFNDNVRVTGIVTANSVLFTNSGGSSLNGSLLIENLSGSYSQLTFRDSSGTNQSNMQGVSNILFINSGVGGYVSINTYSIFSRNGDVTLNNGSVGTTKICNEVYIRPGITTIGDIQVSSGIITASDDSSSGIVTYYGDTSNAVDGRWILTGDGSNYTFTGIGITSGNNTDPKIYLARARVYEFVNTQPSSHPFVIRDSDGGTEWTAGVSTSTDGTNDILRFEVPMNAPNTLFYQCTVHSGMGNTITVYPTVS